MGGDFFIDRFLILVLIFVIRIFFLVFSLNFVSILLG